MYRHFWLKDGTRATFNKKRSHQDAQDSDQELPGFKKATALQQTKIDIASLFGKSKVEPVATESTNDYTPVHPIQEPFSSRIPGVDCALRDKFVEKLVAKLAPSPDRIKLAVDMEFKAFVSTKSRMLYNHAITSQLRKL